MSIPLYKPFIKRRDMDAMLTALIADSYRPGSHAQSLVSEFCTRFSCCNGQALREYRRSIALACKALALAPGSRVALGVLAPSEWQEGLLEAGLIPVLLDSGALQPTIDPAALFSMHQSDPVQAVIAVHLLGCMADLANISALGVPIIEDCSQAPGHWARNQEAGTVGDIVVLAMEDDCVITAGGGTVVLARSKVYATRLEQLVENLGSSVIMTDLNAALARAQLTELEDFLARRAELSGLFSRAILRSHHKSFVPIDENENPRHISVVLVQSPMADCLQYARKKNVEARPAFTTSILHGWSNEQDPGRFVRAYSFLLRTILFPLYPALKQKEVELVEKVLASLP